MLTFELVKTHRQEIKQSVAVNRLNSKNQTRKIGQRKRNYHFWSYLLRKKQPVCCCHPC
ncbi:hypothetical protein SAMN05216243_0114 [Sediminibacillus albus]|uniref:Uncharacterized protein n=1 Tax=Sediminibacillus albus TaxID=407036 RepID=A0A1G8VJJ1_9BACI|nr:hypothetical protein SAMN05216243_0114 [Sediminibacillus albus]